MSLSPQQRNNNINASQNTFLSTSSSMATYGTTTIVSNNNKPKKDNFYDGDNNEAEENDSFLGGSHLLALKRQGSTINIKPPPHPLKKHWLCRFFFCTWRNFVIWLSLLSIIGGIVGFIAGPTIILDVIRSKTALTSPYSDIFKFWTNPDSHGVKTYRHLYLYNITNPYEIVEHGTQPNLVQIGPFVYREVWTKDPSSVRWYMNGTVGYRYKYHMFYEPDLSIDEVTGKKLTSDKAFNVTILNGPMRGTLYRVGRIPHDIVHISKNFSITRQDVCLLLDALINNTIVGPKGIFVQHTPVEVFFGYTDPIWNELHVPLALFNYNASTYFQAQWNGSAAAPSPYTYRSGMMCPLWQDPSQCNNTGADVTLTVSGGSDFKLLDSDEAQIQKELKWKEQGMPEWMQRTLLSPTESQGDVTTWAGQLQGQWWWGPMRPGMTGGSQPYPDSLNPPHHNYVEENDDNKKEKNMIVTDDVDVDNVEEEKNNNSNDQKRPIPFDDEGCRRQYGTDGTRFSMPVKDDDILQIFSDFMGRTFPFTFLKNTQHDGLDTKRFVFNYEHGLKATPVNRHCYQMRMNGLINVSQFVFGDGLVTKAGYLDSCAADNEDMVCEDEEWPNKEDYLNNKNLSAESNDDGFCGRILPFNNTWSATFQDSLTDKLRLSYDQFLSQYIFKKNFSSSSPRKSQEFRDHYETFVDVLPLTGTTLYGKASGQISLPLGPIFVRGCEGNITNNATRKLVENYTSTYLANFTNKMPRSVIPYMRLDRIATIGGEVLETLKQNLLLVRIAYILCGVAIGLGVIGLVMVVLYQYRVGKWWKNRPVASDSDDDG